MSSTEKCSIVYEEHKLNSYCSIILKLPYSNILRN